MRTLYLCPVISIFFSSPNLSSHRLDVCHTSTHGVAFVRIYYAGLKHGAHGSQKIQDAKNRHLGTIPQVYRAISSQLRHVSTIGKKLWSSNISSTCPHNMVKIRPTSGWDRFVSLGHPCKFQRVSRLARVTARHSSSRRQPNFGAWRRGHHLYSVVQ